MLAFWKRPASNPNPNLVANGTNVTKPVADPFSFTRI